MSEKKFGHTIKTLHTDNGTEYCNKEFQEYLSQNGIEHETTAPYTPEQNGRAEREMRTIVFALCYMQRICQLTYGLKQ